MSQALTGAEFLSALNRWKVKYVQHEFGGEDWLHHNRAGHGAWGDMHGVLNHHTASRTTVDRDVKLLWDGRADLPGPLCNIGLDRTGVAHLVGWGRANHAGTGGATAYANLLADRNPTRPGVENVDGNACLYGIEVFNSGTGESYPDAQIEALIRINAAILEAHRWTAASSIQHKEWTARKIDMSNIDGQNSGPFLRAEIARALSEGPDKYTFPKQVVVPEKTGVFSRIPKTEPLQTRRYSMLVYATGRDVAAALGVILGGALPGVVTANLAEARAAIQRGEEVWAVGGPAIGALGWTWAEDNKVTKRGNLVAVNGASGTDTVTLLAAEF